MRLHPLLCVMSALLLCAVITPLRSQTKAQIALGTQAPQSDGTVIVPVQLTSGGLQVAAVQFDVTFDSSVTSLKVSVGSSGSTASKVESDYNITGSVTRVVLIGAGSVLNQIAIPDGTLVSLVITPAATGFSGTLNLLNPFASDPSGSSVTISAPSSSGSGSSLSIVNTASYSAGAVAPGEIVSLFQTGLLPATVTATDPGLSVTFNGIATPLLYAGADQINVVTPFSLSGKSSAAVVVVYQNQTVAQATVPVAATAPGIFSADGSGSGQALILNQDGTSNSAANPAARGSTVTFYGTGGGVFNPPLTDGQILPEDSTPTSTVATTYTVTMAGQDLGAKVVQYIGPAPGLIAGSLQVNFVIPTSMNPGAAVPFSLFVGGVPSQRPALTLAVK